MCFKFCFLLDISIGIMSFERRWKICAVATGIKKYKSIITKKEKKHDEIVLLGESKLNSTEILNLKI